ncbi:MAG TPA: acylphosphatase [Candidatus Nanoarchaeia archaeon]|nr:acylphosphatase [Candidatus Nanoarchaeia archaeon]
MERVHLIITGMVQGVWFRHNTNIIGNKLGLNGFVRNTPEGAVEVIAEGDPTQLAKLIEFCRKGPASARVEDVKVDYEEAKNEFKGFEIRYD